MRKGDIFLICSHYACKKKHSSTVLFDNAIRDLARFVKRQYLDEEQGNKNPTDRSVLVVRDCSWDLLLTKLFAK